jgi:hypothetical protein
MSEAPTEEWPGTSELPAVTTLDESDSSTCTLLHEHASNYISPEYCGLELATHELDRHSAWIWARPISRGGRWHSSTRGFSRRAAPTCSSTWTVYSGAHGHSDRERGKRDPRQTRPYAGEADAPWSGLVHVAPRPGHAASRGRTGFHRAGAWGIDAVLIERCGRIFWMPRQQHRCRAAFSIGIS